MKRPRSSTSSSRLSTPESVRHGHGGPTKRRRRPRARRRRRSLEDSRRRSPKSGAKARRRRPGSERISRLNTFFEKLDSNLGGLRLYGIAPPKLATEPERLAEIAAQQVARVRSLAPDGLVIYDIQNEPGRNGQARPFPFLPTVAPEAYAHDSLAELQLPKVVYRCVSADSREAFS